MLVNNPGAKALTPLARLNATPLSVPSVFGEGEMSFTANCTAAISRNQLGDTTTSKQSHLLNAIEQKLPRTMTIGAQTLNTVIRFFLSTIFATGSNEYEIGHTIAQARSMPTVPMRR
jgi:hypothetical protein